MWTVILLQEVEEWYLALDGDTAARVAAAIDVLESEGPNLGRPLVDRIKGSDLHNLKELRPTSGSTAVRILFVFDPDRQAILLVAGDKAGNWRQWYDTHVPIAEARYELWLRDG